MDFLSPLKPAITPVFIVNPRLPTPTPTPTHTPKHLLTITVFLSLLLFLPLLCNPFDVENKMLPKG